MSALKEEQLAKRKFCSSSSVTLQKSPLPSEPHFLICEMGKESAPGPLWVWPSVVGEVTEARVRSVPLDCAKQGENIYSAKLTGLCPEPNEPNTPENILYVPESENSSCYNKWPQCPWINTTNAYFLPRWLLNTGYSLSGTEIAFLLGTIIISSKLMEDRTEGFMATPENATYHFHRMPLARTQSHGPHRATTRESGKCSLLI